MAYEKKPKELHKKRGPKVTEAGQTYRVWLKPSVQAIIAERHGTLTNALMVQFEKDNKKEKKLSK